MKDFSNGAFRSENTNRIYVIFRVFNLDKDSPAVRIYLDPETMRTQGDLIFRAENWSVVPGQVRN